jgi:thiamine-phosphate pyrophosphorylase
MNCTKETMRLYAVTDRAWTGRYTLYEQVEAALRGGITCLQLREKHLSEEAFLEEALAIRTLCQAYRVPLIINDNLRVALEANADGLHVGQSDMAASEVRKRLGADKILGVSAKTVAQAIAAEEAGADYLGVGAAFPTSTKSDATEVSRPTLQAICRQVKIPVVAIGGITKQNLPSLAGSGVAGVALVSAIFAAEDIEAECRELRVLSTAMVKAR